MLLSERSTLTNVLVVVVVCSLSLECFVSADDVFASSAHLRLLADGEERLVNVLTDYIATERRRLLQLDQLDANVIMRPSYRLHYASCPSVCPVRTHENKRHRTIEQPKSV